MAQKSDSIKGKITNTPVWARVRCTTGRHSTSFYHLSPIARQAHRWLVCLSSLVAFFSFLLGPVLAQMPEYALSREIDFREWEYLRWENIDTGMSILDRHVRFRLEAETRGIFENKYYGEMPVAAVSAVKPIAQMGMSICDRTAAIMNAILSKIPGTNECAEVTSTQLAAITGTLSLNSKNISSLKAGDFDGLTSLTELYLNSNDLSTLPNVIFDPLSSLRVLDLARNDLATLPDGIFDELSSLTELSLSRNALSTLPDGIFDELTSLTRLYLGSNNLVTLPEGISDELTSLEWLFLNSNDLSTLPEGTFDDFTSLTWLKLGGNALSTLPEGIFDDLTSLIQLGLSGNALSTLPEGIFDNLTSLLGLYLHSNALSTLPEGIFDDLTSLTTLWLQWNDLSMLPEGIFDDLTSLTFLDLRGNNLDTLPEGIFDDLTSLTQLWLGGNSLSTLPGDIFDELSSLYSLGLWGNDLSTFPEGIFDPLTSLAELHLSDNDLSMLPEGIFDNLTSLTWLNLSENDLNTLPEGVFEDLTELYLVDRFGSVGLILYHNPGAPFRPVVNASADLTVQPGTEVSIPGSVMGPWGNFVRWTWTQVNGPKSDTPISGALPLTGGDTAMPSFTAPMTEGELYFRLIATPAREGKPDSSLGHAASDPDWITIHVGVATNVAEAPLVEDFQLLGNYPNPFNTSTSILLDLPETAAVSVDIFNMLGQRIHRKDFPTVAAGPSQPLPLKVPHLPSGVYVYQVTAEMGEEIFQASGRMTFIK